MPYTISLSYSATVLFCHTNPHAKKITFNFLLRNSEFYFLFLSPPMGFYFCLPADEAMAEFRQPLQVQSHLEMPGILVQLGHIQHT